MSERITPHQSSFAESMNDARHQEIAERNQAEAAAEAQAAADRAAQAEAATKAAVEAELAAEHVRSEQKAKEARIEIRRNSEEVRGLNDKAELEVFGSRGATWTDPKTGNVLATPEKPRIGKIETLKKSGLDGISDPEPLNKDQSREAVEKRVTGAVAAKSAENTAKANQYKADVEALVGDGYELTQAKLIMDLREERAAQRTKINAELREQNEKGYIENQRAVQDVRRENNARISKLAKLEAAKGMNQADAWESAKSRLANQLTPEPKPFGWRELVSADTEDKGTKLAIKHEGVFSMDEYKEKYGEYKPSFITTQGRPVNTTKTEAPKPNDGKGDNSGRRPKPGPKSPNGGSNGGEQTPPTRRPQPGRRPSPGPKSPETGTEASELNELDVYGRELNDAERAEIKRIADYLANKPKGEIVDIDDLLAEVFAEEFSKDLRTNITFKDFEGLLKYYEDKNWLEAVGTDDEGNTVTYRLVPQEGAEAKTTPEAPTPDPTTPEVTDEGIVDEPETDTQAGWHIEDEDRIDDLDEQLQGDATAAMGNVISDLVDGHTFTVKQMRDVLKKGGLNLTKEQTIKLLEQYEAEGYIKTNRKDLRGKNPKEFTRTMPKQPEAPKKTQAELNAERQEKLERELSKYPKGDIRRLTETSQPWKWNSGEATKADEETSIASLFYANVEGKIRPLRHPYNTPLPASELVATGKNRLWNKVTRRKRTAEETAAEDTAKGRGIGRHQKGSLNKKRAEYQLRQLEARWEAAGRPDLNSQDGQNWFAKNQKQVAAHGILRRTRNNLNLMANEVQPLSETAMVHGMPVQAPGRPHYTDLRHDDVEQVGPTKDEVKAMNKRHAEANRMNRRYDRAQQEQQAHDALFDNDEDVD